jgi:hypothetical protein
MMIIMMIGGRINASQRTHCGAIYMRSFSQFNQRRCHGRTRAAVALQTRQQIGGRFDAAAMVGG